MAIRRSLTFTRLLNLYSFTEDARYPESGASDRACAILGKKPSWHGLGDLRRADRLIFVKVSYVFQR
jgi:hypothetical protein